MQRLHSSTHPAHTLLLGPDDENVTQLEQLIAVPGEEIIIPCHYPSDITGPAQQVTWYLPDNDLGICGLGRKLHTSIKADAVHERFSVVRFPQDVSLRVHLIQKNEHPEFCCEVTTWRGKLLSMQVTRLVITGKDNAVHHISQPEEMTAEEKGSVTLTCSYTLDHRHRKREVLRVSVYWRMGNITGPYAYHPHQEMVHTSYTKRASITGLTNLLIKDVQMVDNTSFYCFVVLKLCRDNDKFEDDIQYGSKGTRLHVQAVENDVGKDARTTDTGIIITCVIAIIIILIILILILIVLKVRGVICKRKPKSPDQQMDAIPTTGTGDVICEELPYCEISTRNPQEEPAGEGRSHRMDSEQVEDGEDGKLLYAKLDKIKLKAKSQSRRPEKNVDVVYADVVKTS